MDRAFEQECLDSLKLAIVAYQTAIIALGDGIQSYTIDTGQTRQTVTSVDLAALNTTLQSLKNQYTVGYNRLNGGGSITVVPSF